MRDTSPAISQSWVGRGHHQHIPSCATSDARGLLRACKPPAAACGAPDSQQRLDVLVPASGVRVVGLARRRLQGRVDRQVVPGRLVPETRHEEAEGAADAGFHACSCLSSSGAPRHAPAARPAAQRARPAATAPAARAAAPRSPPAAPPHPPPCQRAAQRRCPCAFRARPNRRCVGG